MVNNINASVSRITACINDKSLMDIMNNIIRSRVEPHEYMVRKAYIKEKVNECLKSIKLTNLKRKYNEEDLFDYHDEIPLKYVSEDILNKYKKCVCGSFYLQKVLKLNTQIQERNRKKVYDGISNAEIKNSLRFEFDISKYEKYSNDKNGLQYVLPFIKIILFLFLISKFSHYYNNGEFTADNLMFEINNKIDNSIITFVELTDVIKSPEAPFEDFLYEMSQLQIEDTESRIVNNYEKKTLTFDKKAFKQYGKRKTQKQIDAEIYDYAKELQEEDIKHGEFESSEDIPEFEYYLDLAREEKNTKLKDTLKLCVSVFFQREGKGKNDNGIRIYFKILGMQNVNKFLYPDEFEESDYEDPEDNNTFIKPSDKVIKDISKNIQRFFNSSMHSFFTDIEKMSNNFDNIKKSTFTLTTRFLEKHLVGTKKSRQENLVSKCLLISILCGKEDSYKEETLSVFAASEQKFLRRLINKLEKEINEANKKDKAVTILFKYFEDKFNAE